MKIKTGKGSVTLVVLLAIWSVSAIASLPGLAVSPILGDLNKVFPKVTDLEIQMLTSLPSLLIIPFVLLSGKLSEGRDKLKILIVGLSIFFLSGVACLFARSMAWLIVISCILGVGAGMVIPLSTGLIVDYFTGDSRVRQLGYSSAINNLTLVVATAVTGYLAEVNWHLPFLVYTLPGWSMTRIRVRRVFVKQASIREKGAPKYTMSPTSKGACSSAAPQAQVTKLSIPSLAASLSTTVSTRGSVSTQVTFATSLARARETRPSPHPRSHR